MKPQGSLLGWLSRDLIIGVIAYTLVWLLYAWERAGGGLPAAIVSAVVGFVLAYLLCYIVHEWGHWLGARLTGGAMPFNHYKTLLIGTFDAQAHSSRQFLALSWGGVVGYVLVAVIAVSIYSTGILGWAGAGLATGGAAFVVQSLAVDLPQIVRVHAGSDPTQTNRTMATPEIILRRTWQTWLPLAGLIIGIALWR